MMLNLLPDCTFLGPALPEPFVRFDLEKYLTTAKLLPKMTGSEGSSHQHRWDTYRRKLQGLVSHGGSHRVFNHVLEPLVPLLGYTRFERQSEVQTREGREDGGVLLRNDDGKILRVWAAALEEDLDAPAKRGAAYRYSHVKIAQRVLLACGERLGLLTNGVELRLLISDPARPDSQIIIPIDHSWKRSREVADSYRLVLALATPEGIAALPGLVDQARLQQARVTKELRVQARQAIEQFIQHIIDVPENQESLTRYGDRQKQARALWHEGLVTVYRLLFILKLESNDDPSRAFSFASTSLWRNSFSPSVVLAQFVRPVLDRGAETGHLLENGLRSLFRMFTDGLDCSEMPVKPLGGALFGAHATPLLSTLHWGERAVAYLLDRLLWTTKKNSSSTRERVHYGPLDVEDLGRVYEALLELEPGIALEPMCRLRRQKLEVVVPIIQGEKYRSVVSSASTANDSHDEDDEEDNDDDRPTSGKKTKVEWIEAIQPGRFYLRVGLGRKASGSYYTPHSFVRFLVQETLGSQVEERSPKDNPYPSAILTLKVIDPSMGSGHFLVEACRFLGEKLYEVCRLCDELALDAERDVEQATNDQDREEARHRMHDYRSRIEDLPDTNNEIVQYLPSRAPEGQESGLSQQKAMAICRRLVAVHCLYGVDKNPLAVELAKLSLWLESHAEGLPLTFLDHRLVLGDSLTGPFFQHLLTYPGSQGDVEDLFSQGLPARFTQVLADALQHVRDLEASVGTSVVDVEAKQRAKQKLDQALAPFKIVAAAWAGGVMLGKENCDDHAYATLMQTIAKTGTLPESVADEQRLQAMIARGLGVETIPPKRDDLVALLASPVIAPALSFDLAFAEVFFRQGNIMERSGFDAVLGNPPWEGIDTSNKEFFASFDFMILETKTDTETKSIIKRLLEDDFIALAKFNYDLDIKGIKLIMKRLFSYINQGSETSSGATPDLYQSFAERAAQILTEKGFVGFVLPSAFHANEGATGIRNLYLNQLSLLKCYSFENKNKLFEIHASFKFALIIARYYEYTRDFFCCFYIKNDSWLFSDERKNQELTYSRDFIKLTTGEQLNFLEIRHRSDIQPVLTCYQSSKERFGSMREKWNISPNEELHLSKNRWRFILTEKTLLSLNDDPRDPVIHAELIMKHIFPLHEGKTIFQFTDKWNLRPTYLVPLSNVSDKLNRIKAACFFRLAFRTIASATNERSAIFTILPPGTLCSNSLLPESEPFLRQNYKLLILLSLTNSFVFDWLLRLTVGSNITFNFLDAVPTPNIENISIFLSHSALRLTCNHAGYAPLWQEQVGDNWRENTPPLHWPVLDSEDKRWTVRAAIDAVVADAYGLTRDQYVHVLASFSHKSYPNAPQLCLSMFDELQEIGCEAFSKRYDPYWDIPLNERLPQPVIELPILQDAPSQQGFGLGEVAPLGKSRGKGRRV